jgi:hypothetical protein
LADAANLGHGIERRSTAPGGVGGFGEECDEQKSERHEEDCHFGFDATRQHQGGTETADDSENSGDSYGEGRGKIVNLETFRPVPRRFLHGRLSQHRGKTLRTGMWADFAAYWEKRVPFCGMTKAGGRDCS